ncbi:hypothetical protein [Arthrobacter sp. Edens01]|uniref:hypothetical protein n=1 Tax=Arthrobacter sp. Edens01 TaxID=1732020 RepID=UPI0006DB9739|nr:hypothetical protein [Arthrobacter sp. Edens01]KPN17876.1 hypothetical protein AO716_08050 [Arthrobacter sp. Edens01]
MASDYDNQLIESVAVRRNRLLTALLYGGNPNERRWADTVKLFLFSVAVAALIAAVCVGYSFVTNLLEQNRAKQQQQQQQQQSTAAGPLIDGGSAAGAAGGSPVTKHTSVTEHTIIDHLSHETGAWQPWRMPTHG